MDQGNVEIKIKARVEVGEMRKMEESLQREIVQLRLAGAEVDKLAAKEKQLQDIRARIKAVPLARRSSAAINEAAMSVPGVGAIFSAVNGSALGIAAGLGAIVSAFTNARQAISYFAGGIKDISDFSGKMSDLSAQTGQTVGDVVVLGQAFRNAGMGSEMVGQSLNLLQKALTGVNEEGQPTADVFKRLGLSIGDLKSMSATSQMEAISQAIAKLPTPADQARAAMEMFGRSGGRMLAIFKDTSAMSVAREQVGGLAESLAGSAGDLDKFSDATGSLDLKSRQFFAAFAAGVAGDLASAADAINKVDLTPYGDKLGTLAAGAKELTDRLAAAGGAAASAVGVGDGQYSGAQLMGDASQALGRSSMETIVPVSRIPAVRMGMEKFFDMLQELGEKARAREHYDAADAANKAGGTPGALGPEDPPSAESLALGDALDTAASKSRTRDAALAKRNADLKALDERARFESLPPEQKATELAKRMAEQKQKANWPLTSDVDRSAAEAEIINIKKQQDAVQKEIKANAEKRDSIELELKLKEAIIAGNKEEIARLKWIKEYNAAKKEAVASGLTENSKFGDWAPNPKDLREDGTQKGSGFLGPLKRPDGGVSTEIAVGSDFGHGEMDIPLMVPTLNQEQIDHLLKTPVEDLLKPGNPMFEAIMQKAIDHAKKRIAAGKSVFAQPNESPVSNSAEAFARRAADTSLTTDAKKEQEAALKDQLDLEKAKGETVIAQAEAAGKTKVEIDRLHEENLNKQLKIEQQIADLNGEGKQQSALAGEARAQAAAETAKDIADAAKQKKEEEKSRLEQLATGPGDHAGRVDARTGASRKYGLGNVKRNMDGTIAGATKDGKDLSPEDIALINQADPPRSNLTTRPTQPPVPSVPGVPSVPAPATGGSDLAAPAAALAASGDELKTVASDLAQSASAQAEAAALFGVAIANLDAGAAALSGLGASFKAATDNLQAQIEAIRRGMA